MSQWTSLIFYAAVLPHWLVMVLAYQMFSNYFITPIIVIWTAAVLQIWEIIEWISLYKKHELRHVLCSFVNFFNHEVIN